MGNRLRVFVPLCLGLGLVGVFIYLIWDEVGRSEPAPIVPPPAPALSQPPAETPMPIAAVAPGQPPGDPGDPLSFESPPRPPGEGLQRWNMDKLPEGWDPALAGQIADFFDKMDVSGFTEEDQEKLKDLQDVREEFRNFLKSLGPEDLATLDAILKNEVDFGNRRFLLEAIGDLGPRSEEATFSLLDFYLRSRDRQGGRSETNHVIEAMGRLKNGTSYESITSMIDDASTSSYDRNKFVQALGEHPRREESISRFVAHGREDDDVGTRNHAWQAIGKMRSRGGKALSDLISAFDRENIWYVKQTMLGTIGYLGDPSALPFLEKVARTNEDSRVRLSAFNAIRLLATPEALRVLRSALAGERDETVRQNVEGWVEKA
jgi:HEAT repeat protein